MTMKGGIIRKWKERIFDKDRERAPMVACHYLPWPENELIYSGKISIANGNFNFTSKAQT